jgi:hypothetical protein
VSDLHRIVLRCLLAEFARLEGIFRPGCLLLGKPQYGGSLQVRFQNLLTFIAPLPLFVGIGRMPESKGRCFLISFSVRKTHKFHLHSPWSEEEHPRLALARVATGSRFTEKLHPLVLKIFMGCVKVVNIESEMMTTEPSTEPSRPNGSRPSLSALRTPCGWWFRRL